MTRRSSRSLRRSLALGGGVAHGDPRERADAMERVKDKLAYFARTCGGQVKLAVDWATFEGSFTGEHPEESAASRCGEVIDTIAWTCSNDATRKPVAQRIKFEVNCAYDRGAGRAIGLDLARRHAGSAVLVGRRQPQRAHPGVDRSYRRAAPPARTP